MAKNNRTGHRSKRKIGSKAIAPELGYYYIVTDTEETEQNYLNGIRDSLPKDLKRRLVIVVDHTGTSDLVQKAYDEAALNPQYAEPWIVFDRDRVPDFDKIISEAEEKGIKAGWSNPCIEIWLNAYFGTMPSYDDSVKCCKGFADKYAAMTNQSYSKADKDLYSKLRKYGDEESAIKIAERRIKQYERNGVKKPSEMYSATTLHKLVQEVNCKINKHSAVI